MNDSIADTDLNEVSTPETPEEPTGNGQDVGETGGSSWYQTLFADAPTDNGGYESHALNYDGNESTSKIIRGVEGIAGNLNKSVILIGIGLLEKFNEQMSSESDQEEQEQVEEQENENSGFGVELE